MNYDICIEQFSNVFGLEYQDGFDIYWNPRTFYSENIDIRLYKLHGSVMWYESDRGSYIKLPVMQTTNKLELLTGEKAETLILYPMQKWDYAEPLLELLVEIKHLLESENCKFLIVVGYSFRDEYIRKIILNIARKNKELCTILIDPNAYDIYFKKLKFSSDEYEIPSSLNGKVVCLPYKFEKVFPDLKDIYVDNLNNSFQNEKSELEKEIKGKDTEWSAVIKSLLNAEHFEKVESICKKSPEITKRRNLELVIELHFKMAIYYLQINKFDMDKNYLNHFKEIVYKMIDGVNIGVLKNGANPVAIEFALSFDDQENRSSSQQAETIKKYIDNLNEFCDRRTELHGSDYSYHFGNIKNGTRLLHDYFSFYVNNKIEFNRYFELRKSKMRQKDVDKLSANCKILEKDWKPDIYDSLKIEIANIEKSILKEIIEANFIIE